MAKNHFDQMATLSHKEPQDREKPSDHEHQYNECNATF